MSAPRASYLVCATARSGSSLLCEALNDTGIAGRPWEYFYDVHEPMWRARWQVAPDAPFDEYLARALEEAATPNGVWAAKVMMGYLRDLTRRLRGIARLPDGEGSAFELLSEAFPNLRWVWITRRNKVRQAVSLARAIQTQAWVSGMPSVRSPEYDFAEIDRLLQVVTLHDAGWEELFSAHSITPFAVVYEDFVRRYERTALDLLDFLEIPRPAGLDIPPPKILKKQADDLTEQWVERFLAEKEDRQEVTTGHP